MHYLELTLIMSKESFILSILSFPGFGSTLNLYGACNISSKSFYKILQNLFLLYKSQMFLRHSKYKSLLVHNEELKLDFTRTKEIQKFRSMGLVLFQPKQSNLTSLCSKHNNSSSRPKPNNITDALTQLQELLPSQNKRSTKAELCRKKVLFLHI